jgi:N-carbamoylputrescine amidase
MSNRTVKIAVVQETWHSNEQEHADAFRKAIANAKQQGAQLVLLQELTLHRYFGDKQKSDLEEISKLAEPLETGPTSVLFGELAKEHNIYIVASIYERADTKLYNTAVIYGPDGKMSHFTRKQHIPDSEGYREAYFFESGDSDYPVHDLGFIKIGVPTCWDQWVSNLPI